MKTTIVCKKSELSPGEKKIVTVDNKSVVVVCTGEDQFEALRNVCPHQGAEIGLGKFSGTVVGEKVGDITYTRENEIIRCPWHGFEFDAKTGCSFHGEKKYRIKKYDVKLEGDNVIITT